MVEISIPLLGALRPTIELVNASLAIAILFMVITIYRKLGDDLKKAWGYFILAILLFALHEIIGVLSAFDILRIEGFYGLTEFFFILAFVVSVYIFRKFFVHLSEKRTDLTIKR
jgi:hypothetical protein